MHGLIHRAVQCFLVDTYGPETWLEVTRRAELDVIEFEAMLTYDDAHLTTVIRAASGTLKRSEAELKEDIGTYLVSNAQMQSLRRLLRFGGETFTEFLHSLDDLEDRARLAVADLQVPSIEVDERNLQSFRLRCEGGPEGFGHVLVGVLRAMADDYGTLALTEHQGQFDGVEILSVSIFDTSFAEGRSFQLGAPARD